MNTKDRITRRSVLKTTAVGASSVAAGSLARLATGADVPRTTATQVPVKLRSSDYRDSAARSRSSPLPTPTPARWTLSFLPDWPCDDAQLRKSGMRLFTILIALLLPSAVHAAESPAWEHEISARRTEYLSWIVEHFGKLEPDMKPLDGRAWSLNQARLFLDRDTDKASRYFETIRLTVDPDFMGIRLLKTLLDFVETDRLSTRAKENLRKIIRDWPMDRIDGISRTAFWPPRHTENHDLMHLTIGLFSEQLRGQPTKSHLNELKRSLSWRFERGFYEWGSHRYY